MTKLQRLQLNKEKAQILQSRSDSINSLISQAEPFVRAYWEQVKYVWSCGKMQTDREYLPWAKDSRIKELNKQYRLLLKFN